MLPGGSLDDERTEPAEAGFFMIVKNWRGPIFWRKINIGQILKAHL